MWTVTLSACWLMIETAFPAASTKTVPVCPAGTPRSSGQMPSSEGPASGTARMLEPRQMRYTTNPPKGALVFSKSSADLGNGHVQIAVGDGSFVSGGMPGPTVMRTWRLVPGSGGTFLGWAPAPSSWPGR